MALWTFLQRLSNSWYMTSSSHLRLVQANQCKGVNDVIPDTNGRGGPKGSDPSGGGGTSGGKHSAIRRFFVFVLTVGVLAVAGGLAWTHCLAPGQREALLEKVAPALGVLGAVFEMALGLVIEAYDWCRAKIRSLPFMAGSASTGGFGDGRGGYEPLSASGGGLDLDPEDHRSPPLFPGSMQP